MNTATAKNLIPAEFALEITAGEYLIIPTAEMTADTIDWPVFELDDDADTVFFSDGTAVSRDLFNRACDVLDNTQFAGNSNGFHFGVSIRLPEELDADVLALLLARNAVARYTVTEDSLLVYADMIEARDAIGIPDEAVFALISDHAILDAYIPLQELGNI